MWSAFPPYSSSQKSGEFLLINSRHAHSHFLIFVELSRTQSLHLALTTFLLCKRAWRMTPSDLHWKQSLLCLSMLGLFRKNTQLHFIGSAIGIQTCFTNFVIRYYNRSLLVQLNCAMIFAVIYLDCGISISCWIKTKTWLLRQRAGRWLYWIAFHRLVVCIMGWGCTKKRFNFIKPQLNAVVSTT